MEWIDNMHNFKLGETGYLIEVLNTNTAEKYLRLERNPGRTNMKGIERAEGWLGTTNNIDRTAIGHVRVVHITKGGERVAVVEAKLAEVTR